MNVVVVFAGLLFPAALALLDCFNRSADEFEGGADDRRAWLIWLALSIPLCLVLVGYGILLGYYWGVIKRSGSSPG